MKFLKKKIFFQDISEVYKLLSLEARKSPFLDIFTFANKQFNLLKIDILVGIYQDTKGKLSIRPIPGLFLISVPNPDDLKVPFGEVIFLPGMFNPNFSPDCNVTSIFTPGIVSQAIDCFKTDNLKPDPTVYLNKFIPVKLPFNLNGFLSPGDFFTKKKAFTLSLSDPNWMAYPILTVFDLNVNSSLNFITSDDKFMSDLFSPGRISEVIKRQKKIEKFELASTQILFNPTILREREKSFFNMQCLKSNLAIQLMNNPKGVQFYTFDTPAAGVSVLPLIVYDDVGNPIPNFIIQNAINKYCINYQSNKMIFLFNF